ncbi:hypothetical protein ACJ72_04134 [Emergomyces africanus]|uniref:Uncharacterized protein n=1 Tax=Emergomyces africanus TaxID=1955775 RepID=A0A1B7NXM7_9EURO|nr:hypothetical protein ACJ72_04134 [Emergomyces africanus]
MRSRKGVNRSISNAEVILTTRDVNSRHSSVMKSCLVARQRPVHKLLSNFSWVANMHRLVLQKFFDSFFKGDFPNKGKQVYQEPCRKGWGSLCEFLGEEILDVAFARGNGIQGFVVQYQTRNPRQMMNAGLQAVAMDGAKGQAMKYLYPKNRKSNKF